MTNPQLVAPPERGGQPRPPAIEAARAPGRGAADPSVSSTGSRLRAWFAFGNISALYVFVLLFAAFSLWIPDTFLVWTTWKTLLDNQAVAALGALALVLPLSAGVFNLAIGLQVGAGSMIVGWLMVHEGAGVVPAVAVTAVAGLLIGLVSGLLIVRGRIDSFIATLGVSSLLAAFVTFVSGGEQILGVPDSLGRLGTGEIAGVTYPVLVVVVVAAVLYYVLERTAVGRRIYATGGNAEAARLAGVRTSTVVVGTLMACGAIAALGGVLVTARLGNADPTIGPGYLLPSFTAAFLGSTQFRGGRFNVWGTVVAVYVLATGVKGLQLAGAPVWIPDVFNGLALLIAVAMAKFQADPGRSSAIRRVLRLDRAVAEAVDR